MPHGESERPWDGACQVCEYEARVWRRSGSEGVVCSQSLSQGLEHRILIPTDESTVPHGVVW